MRSDLPRLLSKYDVPVPRYTSYPTVPHWEPSTIDVSKWKASVIDTFIASKGALCIYIHLPFCESLCTFCACTKRITRNHNVEDPYISAVLKEWQLYLSWLPFKPVISEIHLGGGTPTFFSAANLERLINGIKADAGVSGEHEFSVEVHPNYTTGQHLEGLARMGFSRISIGVQDFDPRVQTAINRIQSFEKTKEVADQARRCGYSSINVDLVYGLPHQTKESVEHTVKAIGLLRPDRIAFYSYAHVPWKSKGQRRYTEKDLPAAREKWEMYHTGKQMLEGMGFKSIGMDHFARNNDRLFAVAEQGGLQRNFMGYTTTDSRLIIGLGVSAISDSWHAFAQNSKEVEDYQRTINAGILPLVNGHMLTEEDLTIRQHILQLMCKNETTLSSAELREDFIKQAFSDLRDLESDGLVHLDGANIRVTPAGAPFIRNISAAIDARLKTHRAGGGRAFSQAI